MKKEMFKLYVSVFGVATKASISMEFLKTNKMKMDLSNNLYLMINLGGFLNCF